MSIRIPSQGSNAATNVSLPGANRGSWTPNTFYRANDIVKNSGQLYTANADFTSGTTFVPANWTPITSGSTFSQDGVSVSTRNAIDVSTRLKLIDDTTNNRVNIKVVDEKLWLQDYGAIPGTSVDQQANIQAALDAAGAAPIGSRPVVSGLPGKYTIKSGLLRTYTSANYKGLTIVAGMHLPGDVQLKAPASVKSMSLLFDTDAIQATADAAGTISTGIFQAQSGYQNIGIQGLDITTLNSSDMSRQSQLTPPNWPYGIISVSGTIIDTNFYGNWKAGIAFLGSHQYVSQCRLGGWAALAWIPGSTNFFDGHIYESTLGAMHTNILVDGSSPNGMSPGILSGNLFTRCHFGIVSGPAIYFYNSSPGSSAQGNTFLGGAKETGPRQLIYDPNMNVQVDNNLWIEHDAQTYWDAHVSEEPLDAYVTCGGFTHNKVLGNFQVFSACGVDPVTGCVIRTGAGGFYGNFLGNCYNAINMCRGAQRPFARTTGKSGNNEFEYWNPGFVNAPYIKGKLSKITDVNRLQPVQLLRGDTLGTGAAQDDSSTRYSSTNPKPVVGISMMGATNEIGPVATEGSIFARVNRLACGTLANAVIWPLAATIGSTTLAEDISLDPQEPPYPRDMVQVGMPITTSSTITLTPGSLATITIPTTTAPTDWSTAAGTNYGGWLSIAGNLVRWTQISGNNFTGCYLMAGPGGSIAGGTQISTAIPVTHSGGFGSGPGRFSFGNYVVNYDSLTMFPWPDSSTVPVFMGCVPDSGVGLPNNKVHNRIGRVAVLTDASTLPASGGVRFGTNVNCSYTAKVGNKLINVHTNAAAQTVTTTTAAVGLAQITVLTESSMGEWKALNGSAAISTDNVRQFNYDAAIRNMFLFDNTGSLPQVNLVGITNGTASARTDANNLGIVQGARLGAQTTLPSATIQLDDITASLIPKQGRVSIGGQVVTYTDVNVAGNQILNCTGGTGTFNVGTPVTPANNGVFVNNGTVGQADVFVRPGADTLTDPRNQGIVVAASSHVDPAAPAFAHAAAADDGAKVPLTLL